MTCETKDTFNPHTRGSTFNGRMLKMYDGRGVDKTPMDLTGVEIIMQFKKSLDSSVVFEFKTADDSITIPNPLSGEFFMMPTNKLTMVGDFVYNLKIIFPTGRVKIYYYSHWKIEDKVENVTIL